MNHPTAEDWRNVEVTHSLMRFCQMVPDLVITAALKATRQGENTLELSKRVYVRRILALAKQICSRDFCVIQCTVIIHRITKPLWPSRLRVI